MIHLTPEGKALITKVFARHEDAMERAMHGLSRTERATLTNLLRRLGTTAEEQLRQGLPEGSHVRGRRAGRPEAMTLRALGRIQPSRIGRSGASEPSRSTRKRGGHHALSPYVTTDVVVALSRTETRIRIPLATTIVGCTGHCREQGTSVIQVSAGCHGRPQ